MATATGCAPECSSRLDRRDCISSRLQFVEKQSDPHHPVKQKKLRLSDQFPSCLQIILFAKPLTAQWPIDSLKGSGRLISPVSLVLVYGKCTNKKDFISTNCALECFHKFLGLEKSAEHFDRLWTCLRNVSTAFCQNGVLEMNKCRPPRSHSRSGIREPPLPTVTHDSPSERSLRGQGSSCPWGNLVS